MTVKREALVLVGLVLAVDALFIAVYFGAGIERASDQREDRLHSGLDCYQPRSW